MVKWEPPPGWGKMDDGEEHPDTIIARASASVERRRCAKIARRWTSPSHVRLHAGEMTAQEMRSVQAVVNAIIAEIER